LQQAGRGRGDAPVGLALEISPRFEVLPDSVDDRGGVVFLLLGADLVVSPERHRSLIFRTTAPRLPRSRNRRDQLGATPSIYRRQVQRLPVLVQGMVPR